MRGHEAFPLTFLRRKAMENPNEIAMAMAEMYPEVVSICVDRHPMVCRECAMAQMCPEYSGPHFDHSTGELVG
jgi:hypothetical protein